MTKGLKELREDLRKMEDKVREALPDIAILLTITAKAIAERNIRDRGFGAKYSTNKVPAYWLYGKELNGSGRKFLENHGVGSDGKQGKGKKKRRKKGETADPGFFPNLTNWGEFREAQGLQNDFVDLGYSNRMWSNMQPGPVIEDGGIVSAPLAATNTEDQAKMNWNRDRYGDFIGKALTPDDFRTLIELVIAELIKVIRNSGLNLQS